MVQGVFFRASTKRKADELSIQGWVKNDYDGSVLIHAEGKAEAILQFIGWCHEGPAHAQVDSVDQADTEWNDFRKFEIRHY